VRTIGRLVACRLEPRPVPQTQPSEERGSWDAVPRHPSEAEGLLEASGGGIASCRLVISVHAAALAGTRAGVPKGENKADLRFLCRFPDGVSVRPIRARLADLMQGERRGSA
jgi:hypothetical protein